MFTRYWQDLQAGKKPTVPPVMLKHASRLVRPDSNARICQLMGEGFFVDLIYSCEDCHLDWTGPGPDGAHSALRKIP